MAIAGDYQARAIREGFVVQRFWHHRKIEIIDRFFPFDPGTEAPTPPGWSAAGHARSAGPNGSFDPGTEAPAPGSHAIDVGCGSGVIAEHLADTAARVDAVDANPAAIEYARAHTAHPNVCYHLACAEALAFEEDTFDFACCMEVIEHLHAPQIAALLRRIGRVLKPGGRVLVTTPNYQSLWPAVEYAMDALRLAPRMRGDQHVSPLTPGRLRRLGRRAGLREVCWGRFCGLAPFVSVLSWRLALAVNRVETRLANPLGHLLYAVWRRE